MRKEIQQRFFLNFTVGGYYTVCTITTHYYYTVAFMITNVKSITVCLQSLTKAITVNFKITTKGRISNWKKSGWLRKFNFAIKVLRFIIIFKIYIKNYIFHETNGNVRNKNLIKSHKLSFVTYLYPFVPLITNSSKLIRTLLRIATLIKHTSNTHTKIYDLFKQIQNQIRNQNTQNKPNFVERSINELYICIRTFKIYQYFKLKIPWHV